MSAFQIHLRVLSGGAAPLGGVALRGALALALGLPVFGQQPGGPEQPAPGGSASQPQTAQQAPNPAPAASLVPASSPKGEITEEEVRQMLLGKPLILRDGFQDETLRFNAHGTLIDPSPRGPFTLSGVQINRVRLNRHNLELEGDRYGLRFQGSDTDNAAAGTVDRIKITPKKKVLKITIDRELVVEARKQDKPKVKDKGKGGSLSASGTSPSGTAGLAGEAGRPDQGKAQMAGGDVAISPQQAGDMMRTALDRIFATAVDDRLIAAMPDYWKLYYQSLATGKDYRPSDPAVLRQSDVDRKAQLVSVFEPISNEFAQAHDVAGMEMVHTVIKPDGKPGEIVLGQPIGFGLDENAVEAIRNATFTPAIKDGKPVAVALDLTVQFHIYSKLTSRSGTGEAGKGADTSLPGPYSAQHP